MSQVLVLDSSYMKVDVVDWKRAFCLIYSNKAEVLEESDEVKRTVRMEIKVPSVIRLLYRCLASKQSDMTAKFNRVSVLKRDKYICQYCAKRLPGKDLTLDHVIPKSRGGENTWENVVTACKPCNNKKANRTPEKAGMKLLKKPVRVRQVPFLVVSTKLYDSWRKYVPYVEIVEKLEY
jgi:5-methylcytosine-specific restriction endonuclease McrA